MKLLAIALVIVATANPVQAQILSQEQQDEICASLGSLAASIMTQRQRQFAMTDLMEAASRNAQGNELALQWTRDIVIAAYEVPAYSSQRYQDLAVLEFRNDVELNCYQQATR